MCGFEYGQLSSHLPRWHPVLDDGLASFAVGVGAICVCPPGGRFLALADVFMGVDVVDQALIEDQPYTCCCPPLAQDRAPDRRPVAIGRRRKNERIKCRAAQPAVGAALTGSGKPDRFWSDGYRQQTLRYLKRSCRRFNINRAWTMKIVFHRPPSMGMCNRVATTATNSSVTVFEVFFRDAYTRLGERSR